MRTQLFILLSVVFHGTFLWSIFDLYFASPVVHVDRVYKPDLQRPLADRLFFIVGDGLRADKLLQVYDDPPFRNIPDLPAALQPYFAANDAQIGHGKVTPAPFLRSLITQGQAAWGISHTRVPTESRPGHVALLSGMYEDPSAVLKGWKVNPIRFDSTLNQSSVAFGFGSPDIVPMFKDETTYHIHIWVYGHEMEDFTKDAVFLDVWVLDKLQRLFRDASVDTELHARLQEKGALFFLHLLGLDTTGHSYRPSSVEYYRNIQAVDAIVKRITELVKEFYRDDRTAFIFSADHGMSNIGNHGDGNPDNTRTPLIAWGSGIQSSKAQSQGALNGHDAYSSTWMLSDTMRRDVEQADVAALATALLGTAFPGNSVGKVPLDYLRASIEDKASISTANAKGILQQYITKQNFKIRHTIRYSPFTSLPLNATLPLSIEGRLRSIHRSTAAKDFTQVLDQCDELMAVAIQGLRYLHSYDWLILQTIIAGGYLGWMLYSFTFVLSDQALATPKSPSASSAIACLSVGAVLVAKFVVENAPFTYLVYTAYTVFFWVKVARQTSILGFLRSGATSVKALTHLVALMLGLELCVLGYFRRAAWSVGLAALATFWPILGLPEEFRKENRGIGAAWTVVHLINALFPLLPVEKQDSLLILGLGTAVFTAAAGITFVSTYKELQIAEQGKTFLAGVLAVETICIALSGVISIFTSVSLEEKRGLPVVNQISSWMLLGVSLMLPVIIVRAVRNPIKRIIALIYAFAPSYIILTSSYELLFLGTFAFSMLLWLVLESRIHRFHVNKKAAHNGLVQQFRQAYFLLFYIHVAFFSTGNIASISSFYLQPVYRLVGQFRPFLMAALLLYKIFIPFLIIAAIVTAMNREIKEPTFAIFLIALSFSDILTLNFFALVTDQGSWLDIGQSISHFSIANMLIAFMSLLFVLGEILMR